MSETYFQGGLEGRWWVRLTSRESEEASGE